MLYKRLLQLDPNSQQSVFLFGPRGVGKTYYLKRNFPNAIYFDLLSDNTYSEFMGDAGRLDDKIPTNHKNWIIIDEIQRVPKLLNEVHRLISHKNYRFILTGSSARKLRSKGTNLLAGRALTYHMHPLTSIEIGKEFSLKQALQFGMLPLALLSQTPKKYLQSYVKTYLREEVLQEGLVRNINLFTKFLETASFSQGEVLSYTAIARSVGISRYSISNFFDILEDLLIAYRIPPFTKRAKRDIIIHPKFYYFDVGVYRILRPRGPLDSDAELEGPTLETLFLQQTKAINDYYDLDYKFYYWRTKQQHEVDFILYGENGLLAFEVKRKAKLDKADFKSLHIFAKDYPEAKTYMLYGGKEKYFEKNVEVVPFEIALQYLPKILTSYEHTSR